MPRALAVLNQTGIRYPVQIYTGTQTAAVGTPHFRSVPENRVLLLEGFCPKSAKEEEWKRKREKRKREERKRNGRGKEEGTEEARKRKGKEEREKKERPYPTRVLTIPQMRRSQGTKFTHKAHFSPSATRSSPRMEYRNLPHVAVSVVAPQLQWSGTLGSTVLAFGIAWASGFASVCVFALVGRAIIEGSLEVKLPTIWTNDKQRRGRGREKKRVEERRGWKRKSQKREDADARQGRKVAKF